MPGPAGAEAADGLEAALAHGSFNSREAAIAAETPYGAKEARPLCYLLVFDNSEAVRGEMIELREMSESGLFARGIIRCCNPAEFGLYPSSILC
ncbi:MAG: hypothetical protein LBE49_02770 [Deltaproteobacteria bacterium]|nr:hypothetical protein [Deltaproteobacteria bacterium]